MKLDDDSGDDDDRHAWSDRVAATPSLAGCNYYRANLGVFLRGYGGPVQVPVHGLWSDGDRFLTEGQMAGSARYMQAPWSYTRVEGANHWLQLHAPERVNALLLERLQ